MISHIVTSIIFILLILLLLWSNKDTFETIGEKLKYKYEILHFLHFPHLKSQLWTW